MKTEYIGLREVIVVSSGSVKVTIPKKIVREVWRKSEEKLTDEGKILKSFVKKFLVCFIKTDDKILLDLPEKIVKSKDYPDEVIEKLKEDMCEYGKRKFSEEYEELLRGLARGNITEEVFNAKLRPFVVKLTEDAKRFKQLFSERELHFISKGQVQSLLLSLLLKNEEEKEEEFKILLQSIQQIIDERNNLENLLEKLEERREEGVLSQRSYEILRERFRGEHALIERRVDKLKNVICDKDC